MLAWWQFHVFALRATRDDLAQQAVMPLYTASIYTLFDLVSPLSKVIYKAAESGSSATVSCFLFYTNKKEVISTSPHMKEIVTFLESENNVLV